MILRVGNPESTRALLLAIIIVFSADVVSDSGAMMGESQNPSQHDTQPATQPIDEDIYDVFQSQNDASTGYWARLYPARSTIKAHDLVKDEINVGRFKTCEVTIAEKEVPGSMWVVISKRHFVIYRTQETFRGAITTRTMLKDLSMNGTFVNGQKLGKGRSCVLNTNDVIAVAKPQFKVYYYYETDVSTKIPYLLQQKYDVSKRLGTGAFGEVSLVFCKKTCQGFAMKTIIKNHILTDRNIEHELQKLDNELRILQTIKHPNVIELVDVVDCHQEKYLILELMEGKDLFDRITSNKRLTESQTKLYFYQIACGVNYLHSMGIVHRDLKPENVLLATDDVDTVVKITDFGLSKVLDSQTYMQSLCGTKMYVAPEVLLSAGAKKYTGQVDVWSMGVILYVCLSGQTPFSVDKNGVTMDEQIKRALYTMPAHRWECVSSQAKKLVRRMMHRRPEDRITLSDLLKDPWLADNTMRNKVTELIEKFKNCDSGKENVPTTVRQGNSSISSPPRKRARLDLG